MLFVLNFKCYQYKLLRYLFFNNITVFPSSAHRKELPTTAVRAAKSIPRAQTTYSFEIPFPVIGNPDLGGKWLIPGLGQEMYQISLGHLVSKGVIEDS